jgi:hypothetical protein
MPYSLRQSYEFILGCLLSTRNAPYYSHIFFKLHTHKCYIRPPFIPYSKSTAMPKKNNLSTDTDRPLRMDEIIQNLAAGIEDSMETLMLRAKKWAELYPSGEPAYKRPAPYRVIIHAKEVALILGIHLRTAQKMLQNTRFALGMPKNGYVSVKSFCFINNFDEEEIRRALNALLGEKALYDDEEA